MHSCTTLDFLHLFALRVCTWAILFVSSSSKWYACASARALRAVMHGCIVATVQLYHPDGREAMRPSTSTKGVIGINGAPKGLAPGTKRAPLGDELDPFQGIFLAALLSPSLRSTPLHSTHSCTHYCTVRTSIYSGRLIFIFRGVRHVFVFRKFKTCQFNLHPLQQFLT